MKHKRDLFMMVFAIGFLFAFFCEPSSHASPAQVVILRHAEKPSVGHDLNAKGWQRADALPNFFEHNPEMMRYGTPVAVYAVRPTPRGGSIRPLETITPLAQSLGLQVNTNYSKKQVTAIASEVLRNPIYNGHTVVICWTHGEIDSLTQAFGVANPPAWPKTTFDFTWVLRGLSMGVAPKFQMIPELVLPGDHPSWP